MEVEANSSADAALPSKAAISRKTLSR